MTSKDQAMEIRCLEAILDYNMTSMEAKAYKVACIFIDTLRKVFPDECRYGYRKGSYRYGYSKGDPRKEYLFKCCYKLLRETRHKLPDKFYHFYVKAQLDIIKLSTGASGKVPDVSPTCLVGKKAWTRWLLWKHIYDINKTKADTAEERGIETHNSEHVKSVLKDDLQFLTLRLKVLDKEHVLQSLDGRAMLRWIATKQLSPYYAILSPTLNEWLKKRKLTLDSMFHLDFGFFQTGITSAIKDFFRELCAYEY